MIREWREDDLGDMAVIWNQVVEAGQFFPDEDVFGLADMRRMAEAQAFTGVAERDGRVVGLYILHPNGKGRCAHVANCGYLVAADARGCGVGRALVADSLRRAAKLGFAGMQFNAVVATNAPAIALYESMGFQRVGTVPGGFRTDAGPVDMHIFYRDLAGLDLLPIGA